MYNDKDKPETEPRKTPNEVSERHINDVPEITEHELPDELHKENNPDRGTERIKDSKK